MNAGAIQDAFRSAMLVQLGYAPAVIEPGRLQRFATSNRRGDTAGWCTLFDDLRGGIFGCHRQAIRESWRSTDAQAPVRDAEHERRVALARHRREARRRQQQDANARNIAQLWAECQPLAPHDPVSTYLAQRGLGKVGSMPEVLRFHPAMPYWHDGNKLGDFPAMVAPLVAQNGARVALHRTYLTQDGRKARVPSPKKLTGTAGALAGASVPLHGPRDGCLGIAEGIETAIAAWRASGVPTVASYCAGNLASWAWPAGLRRLIVFADGDDAGRQAAGTLRCRARTAGLRVDVFTPSEEGSDWCDVWARRAEGATGTEAST